MQSGFFEKRVGGKLEYGVDWAIWLAGDTIFESTWIIPEGIDGSDEDFSLTRAIIWLDNGTLHDVYEVTNFIRTVAGRENTQPIYIRMI